MVATGRYEHAIAHLQGYLAEFPKGKNAARAALFIGKAQLGLGRLADAETAFEAAEKAYPESLEAHKSRYKLALIAMLQGDRREARSMFAELARYPNGTLAPESAAMLRFLNTIPE